MVAVPGAMAVRTPVPASMLAIEELLLAHVPPVVALLSVAVAPTHILAAPPAIAAGIGLTVT